MVVVHFCASRALIGMGVCSAKTARWIFTKFAPGLVCNVSRNHAKWQPRMLNGDCVRRLPRRTHTRRTFMQIDAWTLEILPVSQLWPFSLSHQKKRNFESRGLFEEVAVIWLTWDENHRKIHSFLRNILKREVCGREGSNFTKAAISRRADFQPTKSPLPVYFTC